MFRLTSTSFAPWIILESDDKRYARVKALRTIVAALEDAGALRLAHSAFASETVRGFAAPGVALRLLHLRPPLGSPALRRRSLLRPPADGS